MQFTITFQKNNKYLEEDFIVSKSNFHAYYMIKNWPNTWGVHPYDKSLILLGSPSSGKTHLTHIWQKMTEAIFLIPNDDIGKLYKKSGCFIIEDMDKYWSEQKLLHIFNILHENNKFLMLTASDFCANFQLPDLISRIYSVLTVKLNHPDEEMVKIILMRGFSARSLKVSIEVINYLASRITREFRVILNIVKLIDHYSLENKRNITVPLVKELLQFLEDNSHNVTERYMF